MQLIAHGKALTEAKRASLTLGACAAREFETPIPICRRAVQGSITWLTGCRDAPTRLRRCQGMSSALTRNGVAASVAGLSGPPSLAWSADDTQNRIFCASPQTHQAS